MSDFPTEHGAGAAQSRRPGVGGAVRRPDDFVFGDCGGVVIIPKALTVEVLLKTEEIVQRENGMRADLAKGITVSEVNRKHGKF